MAVLPRFAVSSLTRSRVVFTGECASSLYNLTCTKLLVEEFHRSTAASELDVPALPVGTNPHSPSQAPAAAQQQQQDQDQQAQPSANAVTLARSNRPAKGFSFTNDFVVIFLASKADLEQHLEARRDQISNMVNSGLCHAAVALLPDVGDGAAVQSFEALDKVTVIDVGSELTFALTNSGEQPGTGALVRAGLAEAQKQKRQQEAAAEGQPQQQPAAAKDPLDDPCEFQMTPREWAEAVIPRIWTLIAKSRILMGDLSVQCWGDSLTEGYTYDKNGKLSFAPYCNFLMSEYLPRPATEEQQPALCLPCISHGVSGELTEGIRGRFEQAMSRESTRGSAGDICVFLAGTNDLGNGFAWQVAFRNIEAMVKQASLSDRHVIILAVPSTSLARDNRLYRQRLRLNEALAKLAAETRNAQFVDLFTESSVVIASSEVDRAPESELGEDSGPALKEVRRLRPDLAADNLHFNVEGYKLVARLVAGAIRRVFRA